MDSMRDALKQNVGGAKATGKEVWRALDERAAYSSPIVIQQAGKDVLVCWTGELIRARSELW